MKNKCADTVADLLVDNISCVSACPWLYIATRVGSLRMDL